MLCRIEMANSEQRFGRFYRWRMLHSQGGMKNTMIISIVLLILVSVMLLTSGVNPLMIAVLAGIVLVYFVYALYIKPNSIFRKRAGAAMETEVFIFTENGFSRNVKNEESGSNDHNSSQYDILIKAVETGNDFLLFTSQTQGYIIEKQSFTNGSPEELRDILRKKLGAKFKTKQK